MQRDKLGAGNELEIKPPRNNLVDFLMNRHLTALGCALVMLNTGCESKKTLKKNT